MPHATGMLICLARIVLIAAPSAGEPPHPVHGLRIAVPTARGVTSGGEGQLSRGVRTELLYQGAEVVEAPESAGPQEPTETCRTTRATYVVLLDVTRRGWLYTARARLLECASGETKMDFRSDYYKPA